MTTDRDAMPNFQERGRRLPELATAYAMPIGDVAITLDIPMSTIDKLRARGEGPPAFMIGRRLYVRQTDLRDWLDDLAERAREADTGLDARLKRRVAAGTAVAEKTATPPTPIRSRKKPQREAA